MNVELHERLIALQTTEELERKGKKASRKGFYTLEGFDYAYRAAKEMIDGINWDET